MIVRWLRETLAVLSPPSLVYVGFRWPVAEKVELQCKREVNEQRALPSR
jgi:hypothetical protein